MHMTKTSPLTRILAWVENLAISVGGLALIAMGGIVTLSVLGRQLFLMPIPDDLTMVGLLMVCVIVLPLAFVESKRGHISVTITTDWLPTRAIGFLRCLGTFAMGLFFGGIGYMVVAKLPREFMQGTYYDGQLEIPTWPMKAVFAFGIAVFVLRLMVSFSAGVRTMITGIDHDEPLSHVEE